MKPWAWDVFTGPPAPTRGMLAELSRLRAALPSYDVIVTSRSPAWRFEAIRRPGVPGSGPWAVVRHQYRPRRPVARTGRLYPVLREHRQPCRPRSLSALLRPIP